jgi:patatin-like phospholipase/acyl hydrolase
MADFSTDKPCRILSLDGGGAKGFYTLGVLREIEGLIGRPLYERFDLIFGTSTGAIIAALLGLGKTVKEISELYEKHVPTVMSKRSRLEPPRVCRRPFRLSYAAMAGCSSMA